MAELDCVIVLDCTRVECTVLYWTGLDYADEGAACACRAGLVCKRVCDEGRRPERRREAPSAVIGLDAKAPCVCRVSETRGGKRPVHTAAIEQRRSPTLAEIDGRLAMHSPASALLQFACSTRALRTSLLSRFVPVYGLAQPFTVRARPTAQYRDRECHASLNPAHPQNLDPSA